MGGPLDLGGCEAEARPQPFERSVFVQVCRRGGGLPSHSSPTTRSRIEAFRNTQLGNTDTVHERLGDIGTDLEICEAVDDAEMDWVAWRRGQAAAVRLRRLKEK
jgi:hypothetical protein